MKKTFLCVICLGLLAVAGVGAAERTGISGEYLESRTAEVYTGPCVANGEVNLTGKEAVMAWRIDKGGWNGVALRGLAVVAVLKARATLGDPHANPLPARAVLFVDERATVEQRRALSEFARTMGGDLLKDVVAIEPAPIQIHFAHERGVAEVKVGDLVRLETRAIQVGDHHCGNEYLYYEPLVPIAAAVPAYALTHSFQGAGLGTTWSDPNKRSAYIGSFSR